MTNECSLPKAIPNFAQYLGAEGHPKQALGDTVEACSPDLSGDQKTECQSFTTWTQYTASFAGVLGLAAQLVDKFVPSGKVQLAIIDVLRTGYDLMASVNEQFMVAIQDINAGKPYAPLPKPDPIPPFPEPGKDDIEQAVVEAWAAFKPWIEKSIAKLPADSPWVKVLEGVIEGSDQMIADLQQLFKDLDGNS